MFKFGQQMKVSWFNPRNGFKKEIGIYRNEGTKKFAPESNGIGKDWMLVFEKF
jgi:hypothetical protein